MVMIILKEIAFPWRLCVGKHINIINLQKFAILDNTVGFMNIMK